MAVITGLAPGGNYSAGGSWVGGVPPGAGDSFIIPVNCTIDFDNDDPAATSNLGGTVNIGGHLRILAGNVISPAGNVTINGTFTIIYGTSLDPTGLRFVMVVTETFRLTFRASAQVYIGVGSGASGTYVPLAEPCKIYTNNDAFHFNMLDFSSITHTNCCHKIS